jgi:hypothetical protein
MVSKKTDKNDDPFDFGNESNNAKDSNDNAFAFEFDGGKK